jgi:hypothetical protein
MSLTEHEQAEMVAIRLRIEELQTFLNDHPLPDSATPVIAFFDYLETIRDILGNFSNRLSFVSCLMAKDYLMQTLPMAPFDVATKPQGAAGHDIDEWTLDGRRVVAEIKTTTPYHGTKLGAQQKVAFRKDFEKLHRSTADHRFLFVTDEQTFWLMRNTYAEDLMGIEVVYLRRNDAVVEG